MSTEPIYLDYQATTPVAPEVLECMTPYFAELCANASSSHALGRQASKAVESARRQIADAIGARFSSEIVFTSGGTESNFLAIRGIAALATAERNEIVTTSIEHKAVVSHVHAVESPQIRTIVLPVDRFGYVSVDDVARVVNSRTLLVSIMHANNEIGTVQNLSEISRIVKQNGALFHTDAVQSLAYTDFNVDRLGVDLASFSAHKIYGPKGVGALYIKRGSKKPSPQILGGAQEFGFRAGTTNVACVVGFGRAAQLAAEQREAEQIRVGALRGELLADLVRDFPDLSVNGPAEAGLAGTLNFSIPHLDAAKYVSEMSSVMLSTGSACNSGTVEPSHVLKAIGLSNASARSSIRVSLGRYTTAADVARASNCLRKSIPLYCNSQPD